LTDAFRDELTRTLPSADETVVGFRVCRKTMLMGRWLKHSDGFPVWIMRVVRRGRAWFADSGHGEVPVPPVQGRIETITSPMIHYPFSKGLSDWIDRHNRYSTREAELEASGTPGVAWRDVLSANSADRRRALRNLGRRLPGRPSLRFMYQYVWKLGFLDGRAGLTFSLLMAMYERMIVMKRRERIVGHGLNTDETRMKR